MPSINVPSGSTALFDRIGNPASAMRAIVTSSVKSNSWLPSTIASNPIWLNRSIMCAPLSNDDNRDGEIASPPLVTSTWSAFARISLTTVARRATPPRSPEPSSRSRSLTCTMVRMTGSAWTSPAGATAASAPAHRAAAQLRQENCRFIGCSLCRRAVASVHNSAMRAARSRMRAMCRGERRELSSVCTPGAAIRSTLSRFPERASHETIRACRRRSRRRHEYRAGEPGHGRRCAL